MSLRWMVRLWVMVGCLVLAGCLDTREELWLEADGSGRARIEVDLPAAALNLRGGPDSMGEEIRRIVGRHPDLRLRRFELNTGADRARMVAELDFASALDLLELTRGEKGGSLPAAVRDLAGEVELDLSGRTLSFQRRAVPGRALPGAAMMPASAFKGRRLTSIIHLPSPAFEHNATDVRDGGRTLVWDVPLATAVRQPVVSRFRMKIPLPWRLIAAGGVGGLALAGVLVWPWWRRRRNARLN